MEGIDTIALEEVSQYVDDGLRDYQAHFKHEIYKLWNNRVDSVLLQMPTGTGKTRLFVSLINDFRKYSETHVERINVLIVTHRNELVKQIADELKDSYNIDCSLITAEERTSHKNPKPVCVASIQTLKNRLYKWSEYNFNVVIIDEAHHTRAKTYHRVINTFNSAKLLGVTATPYRLNDVGLAAEYERIIVSPPIKDFIEAGWLSNYDYYSIEENESIYDGLSSLPLDKWGDYEVFSLSQFCNKDSIRAQVVGSYLKYAKGKKGIVYTINREHNDRLCQEFRQYGINAYAIDGKTKTDVRENIVNMFRRGEIDVLCNVNIFSEGFDCPDVEFIQLARPTKSLALYLQQVGRGLRITNGKEKVIILDNVGLCMRFGLPSIKRKWGHHFVGNKNVTDFGYKYREEVDSRELFNFGRRNPDLSEGCEEVTLIESTGVNSIIEDFKKKQNVEYAQDLKPVIDSIFEINKHIFSECVDRYVKNHLIIKAEYHEDLLNPYPLHSMKIETDNLEYIKEKAQSELKPVVVYSQIDFEQYKNWMDYIVTMKELFYKQFRRYLAKAQEENYKKLDNYTVIQLKVCFELFYGKEHNMTRKLSSYCEHLGTASAPPKWSEAKTNQILSKYAVKTNSHGIWYRIEYKA